MSKAADLRKWAREGEADTPQLEPEVDTSTLRYATLLDVMMRLNNS
jgi:uncharacterized protein with von Willebrand factor type A (vWA) domain